MKKWYCCSKCNEVGYYYILDDGTTTFNRGEWLAHGVYNDWVTTGFDTKEEAEIYLADHPLVQVA